MAPKGIELLGDVALLEEVCHCGCGLGSLICVQTTPSETDHLQFQRGKSL